MLRHFKKPSDATGANRCQKAALCVTSGLKAGESDAEWLRRLAPSDARE